MTFPRRRVGGLALAAAVLLGAGVAPGEDWPAYKADAARSGTTTEAVRCPLTKLWTFLPAQPPRPAWPQPGKEVHRMDFDYAPQPVAAAGRVIFGSSADDTVRALDAATGRPIWRFTVGGPVRFAPALTAGRCIFGSDDGWVYCLDAEFGRLIWKVRGGPRDARMLGNGRMISRWPIRTGVLVADGVVYFAAGMWPSEGITVCAADAKTGKGIWRNDTSGSLYLDLPHRGASALTGVCPQGYLLASKDVLLVPTGRSVPAAFDRKTGRLLHYEPGANKFEGGCWATIAGDLYFSPAHPQQTDDEAYVGEAQPREGDGMAAFELATGERDKDLNLEDRYLVLPAGETIYTVGDGKVQAVNVQALRRAYDPNEAARWTAKHGRAYSLALAPGAVFVGGVGAVTAYDPNSGKQLWRGQVAGQARGLALADGRLIVTTDRGAVACFAPCEILSTPRRIREPLRWRAGGPGGQERLAARVARAGGVRQGYALVIGPADSRLAVSLAMRTDLHVICAVGAGAAARERERLLTTDLYGSRVVVDALTDPAHLPYPPYFADLVVVAKGADLGKLSGGAIYRCVRPCGGVLCLAGLDEAAAERLLKEAGTPAGAVRTARGLTLARRGPLQGAGDWRGQWANDAQTGAGDESRLRMPLALLWFGGPGPDRMMDRHWATTTPASVNGRVFVTGQHHVICFDAYNGREYWSRPFRDIGRYGAARWAGNMVADDDSLYLVQGAACHRLDQATGKSLAVYRMPPELTTEPASREPNLPAVDVVWPARWKVFGPVPKETDLVDPSDLKEVPAKLTVAGVDYAPREMTAVKGVLDFTYLYGGYGFKPLAPGEKPGPFPRGKTKYDRQTLEKAVYAFATIDCPAAGRLTIGSGSDWWMAWALDGKLLYDTLERGNRRGPHEITDHVFSAKVTRGRHVLAVMVRAGSRGWSLISAGGAKYEPQLSSALRPPAARWGYVSVGAKLVLGMYVAPDGLWNEGHALFALDRDTGGTRWIRRPKQVFSHAGVARDGQRVFLLESPSWAGVEKARRRGEEVDANQALLALDLASGRQLWRRTGVPPTSGRMLQVADGIVVVHGTAAYQADTGKRLWVIEDEDHRVSRPPVICGEWVFTHPGAVHLKTGRPRMTADLLTGKQRPWQYVRAYGCGAIGGCRNLLFFRSGATGFLDLLADGTTNFGGVRPGCSVNLVPANGLMVLPESSSGCSCSYNYQTSIALAPAAEVHGDADGNQPAPWYVFHGEDLEGPLQRLRLNLGAPGDRRVGQAAWLAFPRPGADGAAAVPVKLDTLEPVLRPCPPLVAGSGAGRPAWIYHSALVGEGSITVQVWGEERPIARRWRGKKARPLVVAPPVKPVERTFTVRLHFAEPDYRRPGQRVFDVTLQGRTVLKAFDVVKVAGGPHRAVVREFKGVKAVEDLAVEFKARTGAPVLCGLEVLAE